MSILLSEIINIYADVWSNLKHTQVFIFWHYSVVTRLRYDMAFRGMVDLR